MALLGAFDAANYLLYFAAIDRGPIALAVLTHYLAPVLVAAGAPFLLGERLGKRTLPAAAVALIGLALLLGGVRTEGGAIATALLGAASAVFFAGSALWSKKLLAHFSGAEILFYHAGMSALLLLPFAGSPPPMSSMIGRPLLGALLVGAGGGGLFYFGLRRIEAQRAAVLIYLEPLVAALVGALAFGEAHTPLALLGGALVLASGAAVALQK
jgi:drug/metabolite transporter (DMT)-like permease